MCDQNGVKTMIDRFLNLLIAATELISEPYFQLPVAGQEDPIYRERVYCYELFHQLRTFLDHDDLLTAYVLSGEIDKRGHPIIRPCIPDFVLHRPGRMDNLAVMEVKPINGEDKGFQKDRETLEYFLSEEVGYRVAVQLVYGNDEARFARVLELYQRAGLRSFRLLWHREPRRPAVLMI